MESIIAGVIVAVAFGWVVRSIWKSASGKDEGGCGSGGCGGCKGGSCGYSAIIKEADKPADHSRIRTPRNRSKCTTENGISERD